MPRWNSCNILQIAPDAKRLWQFDAKGAGFILGREQRVAATEPLPGKYVTKSWTSLWKPKLNVAWLPSENIFLRVVELPASNADEVFSMVELQLEKLSPLPVTQIVWTFYALPRTSANLQTVVVVIVARNLVEDFLGKLELDGFLADRLEVPMLDQLATISMTENSAWVFPQSLGGQAAALIAWCVGGTLKHLSLATLPAAGDRAAELKTQLTHTAWSGEIEGWLIAPLKWHLVADAGNAAEWQNLLQTCLSETVTVTPPPTTAELAAGTARRAATMESKASLLPPDFSTRYRDQFFDRLWLRGLAFAGVAYAVVVAIYFCAVAVLQYRTTKVERQAAALSGTYTNSLQLTAQYRILSERQDLKYAALDLWKIVAEQLPQSVTLQRFSFSDGKKLSLSGTAPADQVNTLLDFNTAIQNVQQNGQPVFDTRNVENIAPHVVGNSVQWNLGLQLLHSEAETKAKK